MKADETVEPSGHLIVVFIQHDDDLRHVVEFSDSAQVLHGLSPLPVLLLLGTQADMKTWIGECRGLIFQTITQ